MSIAHQRMAGPAVEAARLRRDFFVYGINIGLATSATVTAAMQIEADSDFEAQKLTYSAGDAGQTESSRVIPAVLLQITDTGTGRQMFNTPVAVGALFGDGRIPFILPTSKMFSANATVAFTLTNLSVATLVRLYLIGSKIFRYS